MADQQDNQERGEPQERLESEGLDRNADSPQAEGGYDSAAEQQTKSEEEDEPAGPTGEGKDTEDMSASEKAQKEEEEREEAKEKVQKFEEEGAPEKLEDWPTDKAKYETFGGPEGEHSYHEGPEEEQLGPSSLRHHEDGNVSIAGEEVDEPDEYKAEPIPGGPTDPNATGPESQGGDDSGESDGSEDKEEAEASS